MCKTSYFEFKQTLVAPGTASERVLQSNINRAVRLARSGKFYKFAHIGAHTDPNSNVKVHGVYYGTCARHGRGGVARRKLPMGEPGNRPVPKLSISRLAHGSDRKYS